MCCRRQRRELGRLGQLLQQAARQGIGGETMVERPTGRPLVVSVAPPSPDARLAGEREASAVVFINDPDRPRSLSRGALVALCGLTPREAQLAETLATCSSIESAAEQLGLARESARTDLKRIFAKTGMSSPGGARRFSDPIFRTGCRP